MNLNFLFQQLYKTPFNTALYEQAITAKTQTHKSTAIKYYWATQQCPRLAWRCRIIPAGAAYTDTHVVSRWGMHGISSL